MAKKFFLAMVMVAVFLSGAARQAKAEGESWSSYEYLGERGGIDIYLSVRPTQLYSDYGMKLKFVNGNSFNANIDYKVDYTCEVGRSGARITNGTGGLLTWVGPGSERIVAIDGGASCGYTNNFESLDGITLSVKKN